MASVNVYVRDVDDVERHLQRQGFRSRQETFHGGAGLIANDDLEVYRRHIERPAFARKFAGGVDRIAQFDNAVPDIQLAETRHFEC